MEQYSPPKGGPSSPAASREPRLHLPSTTDPPGPQNPPKPLVWLVSALHLLPHFTAQAQRLKKLKKPLQKYNDLPKYAHYRYSEQQATWAAPSSKTP
jgi:hypothetical protein